jgi:hypothetical protein
MIYLCYVKEESTKWEQKFCHMHSFAVMIYYLTVPDICTHTRSDQKVSGLRLWRAVPWPRRLVAGLSPRRPSFDPGPVHVGFVVDKVALGQVFPRVLHYTEKRKKLIFITGLHNKPLSYRASVASAAGPFIPPPQKGCETNNTKLTSWRG